MDIIYRLHPCRPFHHRATLARLHQADRLNFRLTRHSARTVTPLVFTSRRTFFFEARIVIHAGRGGEIEDLCGKCATRATSSVNWKHAKRLPRQEKITQHHSFVGIFRFCITRNASLAHSPLFWHRVAWHYVYNSISLIVNTRINWYIHTINLLLFTCKYDDVRLRMMLVSHFPFALTRRQRRANRYHWNCVETIAYQRMEHFFLLPTSSWLQQNKRTKVKI